jgi:hypothetical protein
MCRRKGGCVCVYACDVQMEKKVEKVRMVRRKNYNVW